MALDRGLCIPQVYTQMSPETGEGWGLPQKRPDPGTLALPWSGEDTGGGSREQGPELDAELAGSQKGVED